MCSDKFLAKRWDPIHQVISKIRQNLSTIVLLIPILFILLGYVLYPSLHVIALSFYRSGNFTLDNYREFFNLQNRTNLEALLNSILISIGSVILSASVGVPLAFIFSRYKFPGSLIFSSLAILPFMMPPLVGVMSFIFLYGETGILPRIIQSALKLDTPPFGIDGIPAVLLVHTYTMYVYFYMFVSSGLKRIDQSLIESAYNLGASKLMVFRRVMLPLLTPALVSASLLVFMTSMASFSAPFLFATDYRILSLQIYYSKVNNDMDMAATQTVVLSLISICFLIIVQIYSHRKHYVAISKGVSSQQKKLHKGKYLMSAFGIIIVIILLLPHLVILLMSFVKDGTWTWQTLPPEYTKENYVNLFKKPEVFKPIANSLKMSAISTSASVLFGVLSAYLIVKRRFIGRRVLDALIMIPWALPGTVVAMNLILAFNKPTLLTANQAIVGTFWILPLAYFLRDTPLVFRATYASLQQLDDSLEESARNLGASRFYALRRVVIPMVAPGIISGALLSFVTSLGEFVASILLYTPYNKPISVEIYSQLDRLSNFGTASAYSVLLILMISIVFIISNKALSVTSAGPFQT